jgi:hypothetical protein
MSQRIVLKEPTPSSDINPFKKEGAYFFSIPQLLKNENEAYLRTPP